MKKWTTKSAGNYSVTNNGKKYSVSFIGYWSVIVEQYDNSGNSAYMSEIDNKGFSTKKEAVKYLESICAFN